ncbi:unnamed protein product [Gongylonema pulchrum]|uniref:Glutamyl-tRNA(Gln) amidotransferase subunit C, mitochondrial n=1 Tax=Gongylonema pulchrum TaxID=637853 RepID=A0A183DV08_9BILA|nr:unnamed protein product [Gongylonema pulchrum]
MHFCKNVIKPGASKRLLSEEAGVPFFYVLSLQTRNFFCLQINQNEVEDAPFFDKALITHLERLSLVRFSDEQAVFNLKQAVRYANQLKLVDTTGIEPLETLLEDVPCPLREDVVADVLTKEEVLMNAAKTVEDYFVTPPGNIPLEESDRLDLEKVEDWDRKAMENRTR